MGHEVRLLQGKFVNAFVMGNKNDVMDTRVIWMAVQQPGKSVPVKSAEQQAILALHKMRSQLVKFRTAQINAIHGILLKFGETINKGRTVLDKALPEELERLKITLPPFFIYQIEDQHRRLKDLDAQINGIEKQLAAWARQDDDCQRLMQILGVGTLVATAALARWVGAFRSGRDFAAYIGLVPKQTGTGGKIKLLGISKRGDKYLRMLLIHGARAASLLSKEPSPWVTELIKWRPVSVAVVAMANKIARTIWALIHYKRPYDKGHISVMPG